MTTEQNNTAKMQLEDKIYKYFENKLQEKDIKEENKLLLEEIEQLFDELGENDDITIQLSNGEYATLGKHAKVKDVFDKEALAQELAVAKDELKTPFDFSMFTAQGKLRPDMISKYTQPETVVKFKMKKTKSKPRKKKEAK